VDSRGNVYVADNGLTADRVFRLAAGASSPTVLPFERLSAPFQVAVDSKGDVYLDDFSSRILKLPAR
jgi:serine/threonine protein kinase, bacterial